MSKLKFSPNIFVGVNGWNILQKNMNDSIKRNLLINSDDFGIVRQLNIPDLGNIDLSTSFYVSKAGTPFDEVVINEGVAIDIDGNFILNSSKKNIKVPADGNWYGLAISYDSTHKEKGIVSVDNQGVLTGVGTEFTKTMRGFGEFNSKIRFLNTVNGNSRDYEVARVIDDFTAVLVGDFVSESNLEYGIFGTFLDGYQVPIDDQMIIEYDSFKYRFVNNNELDTIIENREFLIAKFLNNGLDVTVEDARTKWWKSEAMSYLKDMNRILENKLVGIDSVKWDVSTSPRDENIVQLSWNFKCSSYTIDTNSKKISLLIGEGGIFKDTSYFSQGDFNSWRVYSSDGNFVTVLDSQKTGTQIVLTTDILIPENFLGVKPITICPPFEEIEIKVEGRVNENNQKIKQFESFKINDSFGILRLKVTNEETFYNLQYRYKTFSDYTNWKNFKNDLVGYYDETSFDEKGILNQNIVDRVLVPYNTESGDGCFLKLKENPNSYSKTIYKLDNGDLLGVNKTKLVNEEPLINLFVGKDKKYQHFHDDVNSVINLQSNFTIVLNDKKQDGSNLRDGNTFFIHITQNINLNTFKIRIVQNYQNATTFKELMEFTENDIAYIKNTLNRIGNPMNKGVFITATWSIDFSQWILSYETDQTPKGELKMLSERAVLDGIDKYFTSGIGSAAPYFGWKISDEYSDKFLRSSNDFEIGGNDEMILTADNMPKHRHGVSGRKADRNTSGGGYEINQVHLGDYNVTASAQTNTSYAGQENPKGFDNRPAFKNVLLIEKYV